MEKTSFRNDINGLRAWAVVAVILFHFGISGFDGGFIGVDIFFVISGFLMTGIIIKGLEEKKFSVLNFYLARATRIIPALLVLCIVLMAVSWFYLSPLDYKSLANDTVSALLFKSNLTFLRDVGYFATGSHEKLLLHTWSLSVEWQFYILFPLVLVSLWKVYSGRKMMILVFVLAFSLSLGLSLFLTPWKPTTSFYILPTRAWEMLAGGLVFLLAQRVSFSPFSQKAMELIGFLLIIASILLFDASSAWPGWRALLPVTGTVLLLLAARQGSPWTGTPLAQGIGSASYSLYLWHWPFSVALVYLELESNLLAITGSLLLTGLFGWISWRFVENPVRQRLSRLSMRTAASLMVMVVLITALPSYLIYKLQGIHGRLPAHISTVFDEANNKNPRGKECHVEGITPVPECIYGGDTLGAIVIGDSHAGSAIRTIEKALENKKLHVLDWTLGGCPTISGIKSISDTYRCGEFVNYTLEKQKSLPTAAPIIIVNRISEYLLGPNEANRKDEIPVPSLYITTPYASRSPEFYAEIQNGMVETACEFAKSRTVYMVRPIPELKLHVANAMGRALLLGKERRVSVSLEDYHQRQRLAWEAQDRAAERCGVKILDPLPYLCSEGYCWGDKEGLPLYFDDDHLNERGGSELLPMFEKAFEAIESDSQISAVETD